MDEEIYAHDNLHNTQGNSSLISTSDDDVGFIENTGSQQSRFADLEISSTDDTNSVGTAVAHTTVEYSEPHQYSFTGHSFNQLKERVNSKIMEVSAYPNDDYRLLKRYIFLQ